MGFGGISIWQLVIVLGIVILLFGTKKLRGLGGDIGSAVKGFKKEMNEEETKETTESADKKKITNEDAQFSEQASTDDKKDKTTDSSSK